MMLDDFYKERDSLLLECVRKRREKIKSLRNEGRVIGFGEDPPEVKAIDKVYNDKISALWETVEDKP